ncbi:PilW family protein [Granulosicoccus antarcticus]|uniref:Type IV pilus assembly protein PilW n=1 Tax=Granulosicoccus antarcticus IMCC3135 TaxID=1192854 RepID=A0A2Z2P789_9GAMM|nr:PilW family protein [Granulosicoccus antarcticus]ASJ76557.1 hypothetical protein IMCC3135_32560 [Granulosicoccus antarcticus IMCC3135]
MNSRQQPLGGRRRMGRCCLERNQRGLSLIELMISMVLGLIVIAAVFNMYAGSSRSAKFTEGLQAMQENGRYGVSVLQRGLRLAGFTSNPLPVSSFEGIDIASSGISDSGHSSIAIRSEQAYDCNGLETSATSGVAVNVYRLDAVAEQLTCQGNQGGDAMAIVEGVEAFRVLYGIDADGDSTSDQPQQYIPYAADINPEEVVALRFALLVNSGEAIRTRNVSSSFTVLDTTYALEDRKAREVFSSTVKLRNRR